MPTKKKAELPEEMTTPLEAQESQTKENITASPAEGAPDDTCDASLFQTETDSAEADASSAGIPDGALNEPTESQAEVKSPAGARRPSRNRPSLTQSLKMHRMPRKTASMRRQNPRENVLIPNRACRCCPLTIVQRSKRRRIRPRMTCSTSSSRSEAAVS